MNPYLELRKLLVPKSGFKELGKVTYVDDFKVYATVNGKPKIYNRDGGRYFKGDEITVQGDVLMGKKKINPNVNVYQV